jgi:hypothetical protein
MMILEVDDHGQLMMERNVMMVVVDDPSSTVIPKNICSVINP